MKQKLTTVIALCFFISATAQINKGTFLISANGNYMKTSSESGVTSVYNHVDGKYFNTGISVSYFVTDNFFAGLGVDYNWGKETRTSMIFMYPNAQAEQFDIKISAWLPSVYFGYQVQVTNKLFFNAYLKGSYGTVITNQSREIERASAFANSNTIIDSTMTYYSIGLIPESKSKYFNAGIVPEITYFVSAKFGVSLGLGGINYEITDWEPDQSKWNINFSPLYWRLGFKFKI